MKAFLTLLPLLASSLQSVKAQNCTDEEMNRGFANEYEHWTKEGRFKRSFIDGPDGTPAVMAAERKAHWASPTQFLDSACYISGEQYEVSAKIKMLKDDAPFVCVPGKVWGQGGDITQICPTMSLKVIDVEGAPPRYIDIAKVVAPYGPESWNTMHGFFTADDELLNAFSFQIVLWKTERPVDFALDAVSITQVEEGCSALLKNPDFEVGDARGWSFYGKEGEANLVSGDTCAGEYCAKTTGRTEFSEGIQVKIDAGCLEPLALYEVTASVMMVKSVDGGGVQAVDCDFHNTAVKQAKPRCPLVNVSADGSKGARQVRPIASPSAAWTSGALNEIKGTFSFFHNELEAGALYLLINMAPPGVEIVVDDVKLTKIESTTEE